MGSNYWGGIYTPIPPVSAPLPICTKKVHVKTLCKPWITPAIQSLKNKKNIRFSKKSKNKTSDNVSKYNDVKEKMNKAIEKGEEKYYKSLLDNTDNSTRKKWDAIIILQHGNGTNLNQSTVQSTFLLLQLK